jgi:lysyl-tRNA synthetase class 2
MPGSETNDPIDTLVDENELRAQRKAKLAALRQQQGTAFPNDFRRDAFADDLQQNYGQLTKEDLEPKGVRVKVAGRLLLRRIMGKASFVTLADMSGRIQLYLRKNNLAEGQYVAFKNWDLGDIIGAEGTLFKTNTGELSVEVTHIGLLTKSLRPLPEKHKGLADRETRYRQRYLDLLVNEDSRQLFITRSRIIAEIRDFLLARRYLEVETPMLQQLAGGATAKPFATYHNALDQDMYLRVAPELNLKRLVVGGFERVFEINRNFRNEGLSTQHNPEFTMLEFYQAYTDYQELMDLTETLLRQLVLTIKGGDGFSYQGRYYDLSKAFTRLSLFDAILAHNPQLTSEQLGDFTAAKAYAQSLRINLQDNWRLGKVQLEIFEKTVENQLLEPTFITRYPAEVSPLARKNDKHPFVTDRFEFFVAGREIANGFSELNDPQDQQQRFQQQVAEKAAGDEEAMPYDEDYIRALEYGLPPTAGEGIGIDRLVMLLTDAASIRDVILFPHLRAKGS